MKNRKKTLLIGLGLALLIWSPTVPTRADDASAAYNVRIVGGSLGGSVNRGYAAFAQAFMRAYPKANVDILPGGAVANPTRMERGAGEMSHTQSIMLRAASAGSEPYAERHQHLRSLLSTNDDCRLHFIARDAAPFRTLDEIRDKKLPVSLAASPKGTTNELYGRWVLEAYGISYDDIRNWGGTVSFSAYDSVVNMMKDNQIDLVIWVGPGEPAFMQEVALGQKLRWLPLSEEVMAQVEARGLRRSVIRADEFNGMVGTDIPCLADVNEVFCRDDVPEDLARAITKIWVEHAADIGAANPGWQAFDPALARQKVTLPLHPGAKRYFREVGLMP